MCTQEIVAWCIRVYIMIFSPVSPVSCPGRPRHQGGFYKYQPRANVQYRLDMFLIMFLVEPNYSREEFKALLQLCRFIGRSRD